MDGWIKIYRKIEETGLYPKSREFTRFEAWIDLLLMVNYKDREIVLVNEIQICKRGQSIRSIESYQKKWSWSRQQVRGYFDLLTKLGMIEIETTNKTTILTICNYDIYQDEQPTDNQQKTIEQHPEIKEKNKKKVKKVKIYKNMVLSEITNEDLEPNQLEYFEITKAFHELFKANLIEAGASVNALNNAKGTWIDEIRLMIEIDGYTKDDLRSVFSFLKTNNFWKKNILSTSKLREKMSTLKLQIHNNGKNGTNSQKGASWDDITGILRSKFEAAS